MIFPYKRVSLDKRGPVVPVRVQGARRWLYANAFVDTGADYSVFYSEVASMLGLRMQQGERREVTVGDGDAMVLYMHTLPVFFCGATFSARIGFSGQLGTGFNILGRDSFFDRFQFCFNDRDKRLRVTRLK